MNTPAHLLLGTALFARPLRTRVILAAAFGALVPDLSLYILGGFSLFVLQIPPQRVFNELYFPDAWQTVFAIDNSMFIWAALLAIAIRAKKDYAIALCSAALLHLVCDMPLHHDDGRPHFWPLTSWVFESPLSYWDGRHGAQWVAPLEAMLATLAAMRLCFARNPTWVKICALVLLGAEIWIVSQWLFFFVDT